MASFESFLLSNLVTSAVTAYNISDSYMILATLATEVRNLSCTCFFPLRKFDLNGDKLEQDNFSNLRIKRELGFNNEDVYRNLEK